MKYSENWFTAYRHPKSESSQETRFINKILQKPPTKILDMCSGHGYHAIQFAKLGHEVIGVDIDSNAITSSQKAAKKENVNVRFIEADIRYLSEDLYGFQQIFFLWQSFGYYSISQNNRIFADAVSRLTPGGQLLLDLHNLAYYQNNPTGNIWDNGTEIDWKLQKNYLEINYHYKNQTKELISWYLSSPTELDDLRKKHDLQVEQFADYNCNSTPNKYDLPKTVQYLFTKRRF